MNPEREHLRRLEERLDEIVAAPPGLEAEAGDRFRRRRRRIRRHHAHWRDGLPAMETLFDDEAHRAKALAGNLGTELEDLLVGWARIRGEAGSAPDARDEAFIDRVAERWVEEARSFPRDSGWSGEASEVFSGFLEELSERARQRARSALREPPAENAERGRWTDLVRLVVGAPARLLRRFLRPMD